MLVKALPDAHPGWSDPSGMNNKQRATMDIGAESIESMEPLPGQLHEQA